MIDVTELLLTGGPVEIADVGKPPTVTILAYPSNLMNVSSWEPNEGAGWRDLEPTGVPGHKRGTVITLGLRRLLSAPLPRLCKAVREHALTLWQGRCGVHA